MIGINIEEPPSPRYRGNPHEDAERCAVAEPRLSAALMGSLVRGLGADRVVWGTDAAWTGSPQWQIEGLRRQEIREDMQKNTASSRSGRRMAR